MTTPTTTFCRTPTWVSSQAWRVQPLSTICVLQVSPLSSWLTTTPRLQMFTTWISHWVMRVISGSIVVSMLALPSFTIPRAIGWTTPLTRRTTVVILSTTRPRVSSVVSTTAMTTSISQLSAIVATHLHASIPTTAGVVSGAVHWLGLSQRSSSWKALSLG